MIFILSRALSSGLTKLEHFSQLIFFGQNIGVDSVHRYEVVVYSLFFKSFLVELQIVTLQDFIFVKRERVFHCCVLDVFVCLRCRYLGFFLIHFENFRIAALEQVLRLFYEFIQNRSISQFFDLDLKNVLDLAVRLSRILSV